MSNEVIEFSLITERFKRAGEERQHCVQIFPMMRPEQTGTYGVADVRPFHLKLVG